MPQSDPARSEQTAAVSRDPSASIDSPTVGTRYTELDALRGVAAVLVVCYHYLFAYRERIDATAPAIELAKYGDNGVLLFFAISGFVIYLTVDKVGSVKRFAIGRFSRLYPAYWVAVAMTYTAVTVAPLPGQRPTPLRALANLTMFEGMIVHVPYIDGVYWTLTIELMFYLLVGALLLIKRPQWTLPALWTAAGLYLVGRFLWSSRPDNPILDELFNHLTLLWFAHLFAAGIIIFLIVAKGRRSVALYAQLVLVPVVDALAHGLVSGLIIAGVIAVLAGSLLLRPAFLRARPVLFFGGISYSLYLVHMNMGFVVIRGLDGAGVSHWASVGVTFFLAVALATALNRFVERPARAALHRRLTRRAAS